MVFFPTIFPIGALLAAPRVQECLIVLAAWCPSKEGPADTSQADVSQHNRNPTLSSLASFGPIDSPFGLQ